MFKTDFKIFEKIHLKSFNTYGYDLCKKGFLMVMVIFLEKGEGKFFPGLDLYPNLLKAVKSVKGSRENSGRYGHHIQIKSISIK